MNVLNSCVSVHKKNCPRWNSENKRQILCSISYEKLRSKYNIYIPIVACTLSKGVALSALFNTHFWIKAITRLLFPLTPHKTFTNNNKTIMSIGHRSQTIIKLSCSQKYSIDSSRSRNLSIPPTYSGCQQLMDNFSWSICCMVSF